MSEQMNYGEDYKYIPMTSVSSGKGQEVRPDIYSFTTQVVNLCMIGEPSSPTGWTLVDAGMPKSVNTIIKEAEKRFGPDARPNGILLTHGHFDHVGAIIELIEHWGVPVYAHELEIPYLTGQKSYPDADPTVEGGLVARISPYFPNEPINLGQHVKPLPNDGSVPILKEWQLIHTPGHSPGHVSFFRESDGALIAGDAFVTVKQESLFKVLVQDQEISGPPRYFTTDWKQAWYSVKKLKDLKPNVAITGHGLPMEGQQLEDNLALLVNDFDKIAIPKHGRYVDGTEN
ncbi:MBL fold metallo-hydrolase [Ureibacillus chungkukjangi]|uniref:Glyoxylase-like metal-dependent hydrolase (Beta-lactamase superfamily II) n=1 Tax=Ureibacillus chungkukjangi TaxID=1202712 RepID=A0A318TZ56_9BACL|nr:MBL fold metallo-hydrolase [Ureibacillus chungkukjangi]MCM3387919.1 MBL fold metallo-hydrolase [Ureibacillus chungkukjangi]PYF07395.1 glyoxylase-like metal-dependent hydrolase (beta-lactamase superfamily II) [Ureibacillus chungkukjangi]